MLILILIFYNVWTGVSSTDILFKSDCVTSILSVEFESIEVGSNVFTYKNIPMACMNYTRTEEFSASDIFDCGQKVVDAGNKWSFLIYLNNSLHV